MVKNNIAILVAAFLTLTACVRNPGGNEESFSSFERKVSVAQWDFALAVENLSKHSNNPESNVFLKATLSIANPKLSKTLLQAVSRNQKEFEEKYQYLAFGSDEDLYIESPQKRIYPIGYVYEPSNGLAKEDRLIFKFEISQKAFEELEDQSSLIEFWYVDKLLGIGKICFTYNN